ncbi:DMT family transporter [Subsaximicrobium wynnwilliamsii]|uniref:DMT family transporter n=1 Tax=Subsaximicrobium wynnwilliamsii TaxID=291179 RepID=A0A5C6ZE03_9FLAO|nr:DMT family transporter [Subsaximicrobium wynnwilliamsii]TXD82190.1 DMT family transporter [Subsaximicrobium wynnwilliamsii]TXD87830.1 DMT family transporter [Subsaximicrobium wynnwilliamsii]TXE01780.1 DMT family transporter [Subsaximicrobium wynnwilliamsii]
MNSRAFGIFAVIMVQVLYGLNYTFAKNVMNENYVKPFGFVVLRVIGAAALFWLLSLFLKSEKIEKKDFISIFAAAVFGVGLNMLFFLKGLEYTTPIHASVITTITPIVILILSAIFLSEKLTKLKIIGVFLGFCGGVLLTAFGESTRVGDNVALGNTFIFLNAISYSIYVILVKKLTAKYHPFTFIKWMFLFGIVLVLPFGYAQATEIEWNTFSPYIWFSVAFVVVGATFGTYFFNPISIRLLKASTVGVSIYLQPVFAGLFALLMGADSIDAVKIMAMCLIFAGVFLVTKKSKASV